MRAARPEACCVMWGSVETVTLVLTVVILVYGIIALALTIGLWASKELRSSRGRKRDAEEGKGP